MNQNQIKEARELCAAPCGVVATPLYWQDLLKAALDEMDALKALVSRGHVFDAGLSRLCQHYPLEKNRRTIERRVQRDASVKWAVCDMGLVLGKDGRWHEEPLPSNRDAVFIGLTRFDTFCEAQEASDAELPFGWTASDVKRVAQAREEAGCHE